MPSAAPSAPANPGDYQPTAVQLITHQREYQNPFGGEAVVAAQPPAEAPRATAPVESAPAEPAPVAAPAQPAPYITPPATVAAEAQVPAAAAPAAAAAEPPPKAELKILPPAEVKRAPLNWEKPPSSGRDPAPGYAPRPPRDDRRDARPTFRSDSQRPREFSRPASSEAPAKSGGLFGWLKGLFGGKKADMPAEPVRGGEREFDRDGRNQHRHHRGGRGRSYGGPRTDGPQGGQSPSGGSQQRSEGGDPQGDQFRDGGQRRRRHRGGRGRHHGGPRSEGQQGGGFI